MLDLMCLLLLCVVFSLQVYALSRKVLSEFGVQLGLFSAGNPERHQLAYDYSALIKTLKGDHSWEKVNRQHNGY